MTAAEDQDLAKDNLTGANQGGLFSNQPLKYLTASSIIGDKVHNNTGENMGEIKDIMIDITTGKIDYFVIEFGGFLGIGIKYFGIVCNESRSALEKAPGFDIDHWPDTNIHLENVYGYWSFM